MAGLAGLAQQLAVIQRAIAAVSSEDGDDQELEKRAAAAAERMRISSLADPLPGMVGRMRKRGARVLGPYQEADDKFRVIEIDAKGKRDSAVFETAAKAERYKELVLAKLARPEHTTASALEEYKKHLVEKGNKPETNFVITWAIEQFFPQPIALSRLTAAKCEALYTDLRTRPMPNTKQPLAADTHRGMLARVKQFVLWCMSRGWVDTNPMADVRGIGRRRPRGKSLGKAGTELRIREARAWYGKALELAGAGDDGAVAVLVAMLLGMRAREIVSRRVQDIDDDQEPCDLLWIPCSKTPAGRRTLEVPEVLRPLLARCCANKTPTQYVFEHDGRPYITRWIIRNVHRVCDLAAVPRVTAHAMRGLLATITAERGLAGHLIAATLGHTDERMTYHAYAAPGAPQQGINRRGLVVLNGGVQVAGKPAK